MIAMKNILLRVGLALCLATPLFAQTPPSQSQIASYEGLLRATHEGDVDEVDHLIGQGADVDGRGPGGRAPIHVAAFASHDEVLRILANAGADMNALDASAYDVVTIAAVADDPELMSLAISLGNDPGLTTSPYDGTALIAAAHLGHVEVVNRLIEAGAPLDHVNNLHWTAVMEAVVLGDGGENHQAVLDALLTAGANRSLADRYGRTPLDHAIALGYSEMVERLNQQQ